VIVDRLDDIVEVLRDGWNSVQRFAGFWGPVVPMSAPAQLITALATTLTLVILSGVALTSLALLLTSLLFVYLLLSRVFGVEVSVG